ncbi:hypothetical protein C5167_026338 [Papaver somniferum]|nr:hypothetical protein C5167_026338 [Papaver somniferum]
MCATCLYRDKRSTGRAISSWEHAEPTPVTLPGFYSWVGHGVDQISEEDAYLITRMFTPITGLLNTHMVAYGGAISRFGRRVVNGEIAYGKILAPLFCNYCQ